MKPFIHFKELLAQKLKEVRDNYAADTSNGTLN